MRHRDLRGLVSIAACVTTGAAVFAVLAGSNIEAVMFAVVGVGWIKFDDALEDSGR